MSDSDRPTRRSAAVHLPQTQSVRAIVYRQMFKEILSVEFRRSHISFIIAPMIALADKANREHHGISDHGAEPARF